MVRRLGLSPFIGSFMVIAAFAALSGCSAVQIRTAKDPRADMTQYKTYAWVPFAVPAGQKPPVTSILDETLQFTADEQLGMKGLKKVAPSDAQVLLFYSAKTEQSVHSGASPGFWEPWEWDEERSYVTPENHVTLKFVDPASRRTVWQGTATQEVRSPGADPKQVTEAVNEILKKYPSA